MSSSRPKSPIKLARRQPGALIAMGAIALALVGNAAAKEVTSGGTGGTTVTTCNPVSSLTYKGDARVGETGLALVDVNYSVKPCDRGQSVVAAVTMFETANPANVLWDDPNAPLSNRFSVPVRPNTSYKVIVSVTDATTGAPAGSRTIFAAARTKPV